MGTKYTFWKLLSEYKVEIPIIQRDYAQGREDKKVENIRKEFLKNLYDAINDDKKSLDFDFVYGSIEIEENNKKMIPLDGQQRLTTLFLLHWYLATKDGRIDDAKEILSKFTYETRISARSFCTSLIKKGIELKEGKVSDAIKDSHWFFMSWEQDPTVKSMLNMLDDIQAQFSNTNGFYEIIKRDVECNAPITFRFLKLEDYGLADSLYIKMNARGKALTDFENFKAKFGKIINRVNNIKYNEFSNKIDNCWTDVFWNYRDSNEKTIDSSFMRYMYFITEMLYVKTVDRSGTVSPFNYDDRNIPIVNYEIIEAVYSKKENIDYFIDAVDFGTKLGQTPDEYMNKVFSKKYSKGKVSIFDGSSNLWSKCLKGENFGIFEKVLLFSIIDRAIRIKDYSINDNLIDYVRVVRNLLLRVRQARNTRYNANLRYENIKEQLCAIGKLIDKNLCVYEVIKNTQLKLSGFSKDSIQSEREKGNLISSNRNFRDKIAELEDNILFKGCIDNLLSIIVANPTVDLNKEINEIWGNENNLLIRGLLAVGDYSVTIGYSGLGERKYFGNKNEWNLILTRTDRDASGIRKVLEEFLIKYRNANGTNSKEKINNIIDNYIINCNEKDWRYYFIKYTNFIKVSGNIFTWDNSDLHKIRRLGGSTLSSYHINPYVEAVVFKLGDSLVCDINDCYGLNYDETPLNLKNGIVMECTKEGWIVKFPAEYIDFHQVNQIKSLDCINDKEKYLLRITSNKDRVEEAIDFINGL